METLLEIPMQTSFQTGSETGFQNCLAKCKESGVPAKIGFYGAVCSACRRRDGDKRRQRCCRLLTRRISSLNHRWGLVSAENRFFRASRLVNRPFGSLQSGRPDNTLTATREHNLKTVMTSSSTGGYGSIFYHTNSASTKAPAQFFLQLF
jgi:hypothetical protein